MLPACAGTPARCAILPQVTAPSRTGVSIDAAVLALTESFVVNNYTVGGSEGPLNIYGSSSSTGVGRSVPSADNSLRLPQALHLGPAAELSLPTELPGALHGLVGPDLDHRRLRALDLRTAVPTLHRAWHPDNPVAVLRRHPWRAARLPEQHRSGTAHQCHRNRQCRGYRRGDLGRPRHQARRSRTTPCQRQPCLRQLYRTDRDGSLHHLGLHPGAHPRHQLCLHGDRHQCRRH